MLNELAKALRTTDNKQKLAKLKHVNACLLPESQYHKSAGFAAIDLGHEAACELSLDDISLDTTFLQHRLRAPLMIAPMTGGVQLGGILNERWAKAAEYFGIPFGVGSQRLMIDDDEVAKTFNVRAHAKTAFVFANLGARQIVGAAGVEYAKKAVSSINANAIFLHLNPMQEVCKADGDRDFSSVLHAIALVVNAFSAEKIPVLVREVGFGISERAARLLIDTGVSGLDCAGAGGTSWAKVEALCAQDEVYKKLGRVMGEWGIPTVESIKNVRRVDSQLPLIATGGLRSGLDVAKAIALGADIGAMAQPMLVAAVESEEALFSFIEQTLMELRVSMFAAGLKSVEDLRGLAHSRM